MNGNQVFNPSFSINQMESAISKVICKLRFSRIKKKLKQKLVKFFMLSKRGQKISIFPKLKINGENY